MTNYCRCCRSSNSSNSFFQNLLASLCLMCLHDGSCCLLCPMRRMRMGNMLLLLLYLLWSYFSYIWSHTLCFFWQRSVGVARSAWSTVSARGNGMNRIIGVQTDFICGSRLSIYFFVATSQCWCSKTLIEGIIIWTGVSVSCRRHRRHFPNFFHVGNFSTQIFCWMMTNSTSRSVSLANNTTRFAVYNFIDFNVMSNVSFKGEIQF